jgi:hypothetical protein
MAAAPTDCFARPEDAPGGTSPPIGGPWDIVEALVALKSMAASVQKMQQEVGDCHKLLASPMDPPEPEPTSHSARQVEKGV